MANEVSPLLRAIADVDNLTLAWREVRKNIEAARRNRSRGVDDVSVAAFEADWSNQMETLAAELLGGRYRPLPPLRFRVPKRDGGQRVVAVLAVRDRVAQRAVHQVLEPLFEPTFHDCSYGCRRGAATPHALAQVERYRAAGYSWAAHADIADFFDSINHRILLTLVGRRVRERAALELIAAWLQAGLLDPTAENDGGPWWQHGSAALERLAAPDSVMNTGKSGGSAWLSGAEVGAVAPLPVGAYTDGAEGRIAQVAVRDLLGQGLSVGWSLAKPALARKALPVALRVAGSYPLVAGVAAAGAAATGLGVLAWRTLHREELCGALQGGALSPLLANVYLSPFDHEMSKRGHKLVRYVDDLLLLGRSREEVEAALHDARELLHGLKLSINESKTALCGPEESFVFLGYRLPALARPANASFSTFREAEAALRGAVRRKRQG